MYLSKLIINESGQLWLKGNMFLRHPVDGLDCNFEQLALHMYECGTSEVEAAEQKISYTFTVNQDDTDLPF